MIELPTLHGPLPRHVALPFRWVGEPGNWHLDLTPFQPMSVPARAVEEIERVEEAEKKREKRA